MPEFEKEEVKDKYKVSIKISGPHLELEMKGKIYLTLSDLLKIKKNSRDLLNDGYEVTP